MVFDRVYRPNLIAAIAALSFLVGACSKTEPLKIGPGHAASADLRTQALSGSRADFGLGAVPTPTTPWGVIMETGFPEGSYTLVTLSDGSASLYYSSGGGYIGGSAHKSIRLASQAMVALAAEFQPRGTPTKAFPPPGAGQTVFYLLTDSGVFTSSASAQELGEEQHAWSPLFFAGHDVIGEFRLIDERNE